MPLPALLIPAIIAGATGLVSSVRGASKMKEANDTMESAQRRHQRNITRFEKENEATSVEMDKLGKAEMEILKSFGEFSDVFEQIHNKPKFESYTKNGVTLPKYDAEQLKEVSVGAGVLLGGLSGAGLGVAGGFAAAGATTSAVMALGTASTGTAIASLSGAAATNATLAALGGGAIAAGGGGIAAGIATLGASTLGVGLLVGGAIFNYTGSKLSEKADEAWTQMKRAESKINKICDYLIELRKVANEYYTTLISVRTIYQNHLNEMKLMINVRGHKNWNTFTTAEKELTENTVLLVGLLYNMCKIEMVLKGDSDDDIKKINTADIRSSINNASAILSDKFEKQNVM